MLPGTLDSRTWECKASWQSAFWAGLAGCPSLMQAEHSHPIRTRAVLVGRPLKPQRQPHHLCPAQPPSACLCVLDACPVKQQDGLDAEQRGGKGGEGHAHGTPAQRLRTCAGDPPARYTRGGVCVCGVGGQRTGCCEGRRARGVDGCCSCMARACVSEGSSTASQCDALCHQPPLATHPPWGSPRRVLWLTCPQRSRTTPGGWSAEGMEGGTVSRLWPASEPAGKTSGCHTAASPRLLPHPPPR